MLTPEVLIDVQQELSRREPVFHRPEFGTSREDLEAINDHQSSCALCSQAM